MADPARQLAAARRQAKACRRCDLWAHATQVVFGEGWPDAPLMLVGEQPGDAEDREGHPFVGPAGTLLRHVLDEVGIAPDDVYLTNAVKHFKFKARGKRRIHDKPNWTEVKACDYWLRLELANVTPDLVVCLGGTAAQALLGRAARVGELRGRVLDDLELGVQVLVTIHPSAVLRAGDRRREMRAQLAEDLALAREVVSAARTTG